VKKIFGTTLLLLATLSAQAAPEKLTVYKDVNCGCCANWVTYLQEQGYQVDVVNSPDIAAVKAKLQVPADMQSCHTAVIDRTGQVVEGHVPAGAIAKLIASPAVPGIAVPGMPRNSPGMGQLDGNLTTVDFAGKPFSKD
jgi:hypothetical protein